uniref:Uncharacterized protein n=1 Tax=Vitis vinifera TaxID=29760 RepID=A5BVQ2_VITVI|nr:hypothetical protein VITISV_007506 [Vitis vinifera]
MDYHVGLFCPVSLFHQNLFVYRCVMTGVRVQKIIIQQQQRPTSSCIYHRKLRLKANQELEQVVESEATQWKP